MRNNFNFRVFAFVAAALFAVGFSLFRLIPRIAAAPDASGATQRNTASAVRSEPKLSWTSEGTGRVNVEAFRPALMVPEQVAGRIRVVDEKGEPLSGAVLATVDGSRRRIELNSAIRGTAGPAGIIPVSRDVCASQAACSVVCEGFLPSEPFSIHSGMDVMIELRRGHSLRLQCSGAKKLAVPDVLVELSRSPFSRHDATTEPDPSVSLPGIDRQWAVYSARSDSSGEVLLRGLEDGEYHVRTRLPYVVTKSSAPLGISVPSVANVELEISLAVAYGVEFSSSSPLTPTVYTGTPRFTSAVGTQVRAIKNFYAAQHPKALLAVSWGPVGVNREATFRAFQHGLVVEEFKRTLVPVDQARDPELVHVSPAAARAHTTPVVLRVQHGGQAKALTDSSFSCFLLPVRLKDSNSRFAGVMLNDGSSERVPPGVYMLRACESAAKLSDDFGREFVIPEAEDEFRLEIAFSRAAYPVVFEVVGPDGKALDGVKLRVTAEGAEHNFSVDPSHRPQVVCQLSGFRYSIELDNAGQDGTLLPEPFWLDLRGYLGQDDGRAREVLIELGGK